MRKRKLCGVVAIPFVILSACGSSSKTASSSIGAATNMAANSSPTKQPAGSIPTSAAPADTATSPAPEAGMQTINLGDISLQVPRDWASRPPSTANQIVYFSPEPDSVTSVVVSETVDVTAESSSSNRAILDAIINSGLKIDGKPAYRATADADYISEFLYILTDPTTVYIVGLAGHNDFADTEAAISDRAHRNSPGVLAERLRRFT